MLVVSKTINIDHDETQPAGGIVPSFTDPRLSYMAIRLYTDARGMYE